MRLAQLEGTRIEGTLQIAEAAINDLLSHASASGGHKPTVTLLPDNRLLVRYGMFHAHAELPATTSPSRSPHLTIALASIVVAWGLRAVVHQPFMHFHGRHLTIDLLSIPQLATWRELWKHLQAVRFDTAPGALRVGFLIHVKGGRDSSPAERNHARMD